MADIATLGLALDSRPIVAGTKALDDLARAAKPAATSATALEKAVAGAGAEATNLGKAGTNATAGVTALDKAAKNSSTSLTTITKSGALARHEMINLGRQAQDIGVSLMGGMSPLTVLAQQGSQVFDIFSSSKTGTVGGALKQIGSGIASVITPARALGLGLGAVAVVGYTVYNALSQSARAADDLAKSANVSISAVRGFQTLASFKGIGADESAKAFASMARGVYDAKNSMGGLAEVFRANNIQAKDFNGYLDGASTLIRRAAGNTQLQFSLLQQMGLPATQKWVDLLEQGGEALRKVINSNGTNDAAEQKLADSARRFDDAWNKATTNTSNYLKSWALGAYSMLDSLIGKASSAAGNFTRALGGVAPVEDRPRVVITQKAPAEAPPLDPAVLARRNSLESAYYGILGQQASIKQVIAGVDVQIRQYNLQPGAIALTETQIATMKRLAAEQALGITQIKAGTDAYTVETATLGMATGQAAAYAAAQTAINDAKRVGRPLTALDIAGIQATASALGEAAQRSENMRTGYNALTNAGQTFASSLQNGATAMDSLKKAGVSALNTISSKLMEMATNRLWQSAFGGSTGGIFSGLGSLFGGSGATATAGLGGLAAIHHTGYGPGDSAPTRAVDPRLFINAPRFHSGIGPGEKAAIIRTDESVLTPGQMKAIGNRGGNAPQNVHVTVGVSVDDQGNLQAYVKDVAQTAASKGIEGFVKSPTFPATIAIAASKGRGMRN